MGNAGACCNGARQHNTPYNMQKAAQINEVFNAPRVFKQGYLFKKAGTRTESNLDVTKEAASMAASVIFGDWKKRYFVFDRTTVSYFEDEESFKNKHTPKGTMPVQSDDKFVIRELPAETEVPIAEPAAEEPKPAADTDKESSESDSDSDESSAGSDANDDDDEDEELDEEERKAKEEVKRAKEEAKKAKEERKAKKEEQKQAELARKAEAEEKRKADQAAERALYFEIVTSDRVMLVRAETAVEKSSWMAAYQEYVSDMQKVREQLAAKRAEKPTDSATPAPASATPAPTDVSGLNELPEAQRQAVEKFFAIEKEFPTLKESELAKGKGKQLNHTLKEIKPILAQAKSDFPEFMRPIILRYNAMIQEVPQKVNAAILTYNRERAAKSSML